MDQQNKLQTTLFRKPSDRQNFLNAKSENPYSLMKSIPYSQAVQIRRICSTFQDYHNHSRKLIEKFVNKGYKKVVATQQIQKVEQLDKKQLLHQEKFKRYSNKTLAHTYYSQIKVVKKTFSALPIIAFRKNTSLKQIIGTNIIHNNEKIIKTKNNHYTGKCVPCNLTRCLCCQQIISTTTFKSNRTNKTFKICHRVNC